MDRDPKRSRSSRAAILEGTHYVHPLTKRQGLFIIAPYVTLEQGTGLVHTAPGHGAEDYVIGVEYGLEPYAPVDDDGKFTDDVEDWAGLHVHEANGPIVERLRAARGSPRPHRGHSLLPPLLAVEKPGDLPRHQPVVHPHGPTGASRAVAGSHSRAPTGSPTGARPGSTEWSRTDPIGASRDNECGASRSPS